MVLSKGGTARREDGKVIERILSCVIDSVGQDNIG